MLRGAKVVVAEVAGLTAEWEVVADVSRRRGCADGEIGAAAEAASCAGVSFQRAMFVVPVECDDRLSPRRRRRTDGRFRGWKRA